MCLLNLISDYFMKFFISLCNGKLYSETIKAHETKSMKKRNTSKKHNDRIVQLSSVNKNIATNDDP